VVAGAVVTGAAAVLLNMFGPSLPGPIGGILFGIALSLTFIGIAAASVLGLLFASRSKAELQAGYTTAPGKYRDHDLVDPRFGVVLRAANMPMLSGRQFKEARAAVESELATEVNDGC
jgi:hypothetical protein